MKNFKNPKRNTAENQINRIKNMQKKPNKFTEERKVIKSNNIIEVEEGNAAGIKNRRRRTKEQRMRYIVVK